MVRHTDLVSWYCRHLSREVFLIFLALAFLVGWIINPLVPSPDFPFLAIGAVGFSALIYYAVKRSVRTRCADIALGFARDFAKNLEFQAKTTEKLVDAADIRVLSTLHESREVGGDYVSLIERTLHWFATQELLARIGKLHALGYLHAEKGFITITPEGLDLLAIPLVAFQARVPKEIAPDIASIKLALRAGNFNEVVDGANRLFERMLRRAFEARFPSDYESEWAKLFAQQKHHVPYDRASLGELMTGAQASGIIKGQDKYLNLLAAYLKIRVSQKHDVGQIVLPESTALATMNLVETFVRLWYEPGHAEAA